MKAGNVLLASTIASCLLVAAPLCRARVKDDLTLSGHIQTDAAVQTQMSRFNLKLYPPKESNRPISLATTDGGGNFRFTGLAQGSYLLEIYFGQDLVYQEVVSLDGNRDLGSIDLRGKSGEKKASPLRTRRRRAED